VAVLALGVSANAQVLFSSQATFISESPYLGGPDTNFAGQNPLYAIGTPGVYSYPLVQFDLSSYAGQEVTGTPQLWMYVSGDWGNNSNPRSVAVYPVTVPWNAGTVTYDNFDASGIGAGVEAPVDTETVNTPQGWYQWNLPASLVQDWIDDPSSNDGLLVSNLVQDNFYDLYFSASSANVDRNLGPELRFTTAAQPSDVPEPGICSLIFGAGATALTVLRGRRRR
jgi:hypothetical protein